jgi:hypothetical protein
VKGSEILSVKTIGTIAHFYLITYKMMAKHYNKCVKLKKAYTDACVSGMIKHYLRMKTGTE